MSSPSENNRASLTSALNEVNSDTVHDNSSPSASSPTQVDSSVSNVASNNTLVANEGTVPAVSVTCAEQIDEDGVGPPLPVELVASMLETAEDSELLPGGGKNGVDWHPSRLEQIHDDIEPLHPSAVADSFEQPDTFNTNITASTDRGHAASANTRLASMDETSSLAPVPFNPAEFEDDYNETTKKIGTASDVDSIMPPPCYADQPEAEDNLSSLTTWGRRFLMRVRRSTNSGPPANGDVDEESPPTNVGRDRSSTGPNDDRVRANNANRRPHLEEEPRQDSTPVIPEAFLVEDNNDQEVVIATPLEPQLPWWKQERARLPLAVVCVVIIVLSIALGVALSLDPEAVTNTPTTSPSFPPSMSSLPSYLPSMAPSFPPSSLPSISSPPSSSFPPSSSPSMALTEALFDNDCAPECNPEVAIYGDTVVVTRSKIDIHFFSSTNSSFDLITKIGIEYVPTDVAINGNTAVIGSPWEIYETGAVYVYEKDQNGIWNLKMRIVPSDIRTGAAFGYSVAIDGDVIVVGAYDDGEEEQGSVYIYRRTKTIWIEEAKLTLPGDSDAQYFGQSVSVNGNRIVVGDFYYGDNDEGAVFVYEYDSPSDSWNSLGDTLMNNDCAGSFGEFVGLTDDEGLMVSCGDRGGGYYEKQEIGDEYVLQQIIGFDNSVGSISIDGNAMVVSELREGRSGVIHFFVRKNHVWEKVAIIDELTFDESFGWEVALSGNTTLIASLKNVYPVEDYFSS